jgi:CubicO group peptidase (beta-lactamase class C family)
MQGDSTAVLRRRKAFRVHAAVFVVVQVLLFAIWDLQRWLGGTNTPWFLYVMVVWGIALAAHYAKTRDDPGPPPAPHHKSRLTAKKAAALIAATLGLLIGGTYLFLERPWSSYSLIDMLTMFDSDNRVYSFSHMDQIFPAEPITAAPVPYELPRKERPLPATYRFDGENRSLDRFLKRTSTTGLLVIKGGAVVHERYYLGTSASSRLTSWSMAKSFVGTLVGQALAAGRIHSLDDPISAYVPELVDTSYAGVPVRDVLEMASGVEFDETYGSPLSDINLFFAKLFAFGQSANDVMDDHGRTGPPGEVFHYSSLDSQALGMLVSAVYHRPLVKVLEDRLWHPLGARAAYWNIDDTDGSGTPLAFCCINARLRDFARLGQLYLQGGNWQGRQLLPASWVKQSTTPGAPFLEPGALLRDDQNGQNGYAYQWWIPPGGHRRYMAAGLLGQYIYVSEPDNVVIARTSTDPNSGDDEKETLTVFRTIADALREPATTPAGRG